MSNVPIQADMLKFKDNKFSLLPETDLKTNDILERANLQEAIVNSWQEFVKEIKMPDLQFIGQEVVPDERIQDRIDILAFDPNDNVPVVIELKRNKDKYQLLQSIAYAAMISSWDSDRFSEEIKEQKITDPEIEDSLSSFDSEESIRIILIAENFGPETMVAANWLYENFGVDIVAVSISVFKRQDEIYFSFEQKLPLPELHDTYDLKKKKRGGKAGKSERTWEDLVTTFNYEWGEELLEKCRKEKEGNPNRKRISKFRIKQDGFKWINLIFRIKFVKVYTHGQPEDAEEILRSKFRDEIEVDSLSRGYAFRITKRTQYEDLCKWLKITE